MTLPTPTPAGTSSAAHPPSTPLRQHWLPCWKTNFNPTPNSRTKAPQNISIHVPAYWKTNMSLPKTKARRERINSDVARYKGSTGCRASALPVEVRRDGCGRIGTVLRRSRSTRHVRRQRRPWLCRWTFCSSEARCDGKQHRTEFGGHRN